MVYINAPHGNIAQYCADQMRLRRKEWCYIESARQLRGWRGSSIVMVDDRRFVLNDNQQRVLNEIAEMIAVLELEVVEWIV